MLISIALALLATADGLSLKLKKRKIRTKRDFSAKTLEKVRWERDTDMDHGSMDMNMGVDMGICGYRPALACWFIVGLQRRDDQPPSCR